MALPWGVGVGTASRGPSHRRREAGMEAGGRDHSGSHFPGGPREESIYIERCRPVGTGCQKGQMDRDGSRLRSSDPEGRNQLEQGRKTAKVRYYAHTCNPSTREA